MLLTKFIPLMLLARAVQYRLASGENWSKSRVIITLFWCRNHTRSRVYIPNVLHQPNQAPNPTPNGSDCV